MSLIQPPIYLNNFIPGISFCIDVDQIQFAAFDDPMVDEQVVNGSLASKLVVLSMHTIVYNNREFLSCD